MRGDVRVSYFANRVVRSVHRAMVILAAVGTVLAVFDGCPASSLLSDVEQQVKTSQESNQPTQTVATPTISPATGSYSADQSVTISCPTSGADIHYTMDGSTPSVSTASYTQPLSLVGNGTMKTIKAIGTKSGWIDSQLAQATITIDYMKVSTPQISPAAGDYTGTQTIAITCSNSGSMIYFTTDGSDPAVSVTRQIYASPFSVSGIGTAETVIAIAEESGMANSTEASATYTFSLPLTVSAVLGGTTSPSGTANVAPGSATSITATPIANYGFVSWSQTAGTGAAIFGNAYSASTTVTCSGGDVTIQATFDLIITTVAGDGTAGYSGDGGAPNSAKLNVPASIVLDGSGNLYIADNLNNRIREVSASTGNISTVVGNGTAGYSGDGGTPISAKLYGPWGIAIDASGNLYIADTDNNRIREVSASTGIISTVAGDGTSGYSGDGGAATSAELSYPSGIALDASGNLFVADTANRRVRKVDLNTGVISTVAGDGTAGYSGDGGAASSARLFNPWSIAIDASGNVYIADTGNDRIRKVDTSTGIISTVSGNGTAGYSGDGGAATSAELAGPMGITLDGSGNLYIADTGNARIRKVDASTGIISTVAGDGTAGYSGDGGAATSAELNSPYGIALDSSGNLYIADRGNERIREVPLGYRVRIRYSN